MLLGFHRRQPASLVLGLIRAEAMLDNKARSGLFHKSAWHRYVRQAFRFHRKRRPYFAFSSEYPKAHFILHTLYMTLNLIIRVALLVLRDDLRNRTIPYGNAIHPRRQDYVHNELSTLHLPYCKIC